MKLFLTFLLLSFMLTNCPTEDDTDIVDMTATVSPEEAGDVNPKQGSYIAGSEITIETEAVDDRWEFTGWEGDTTASDDSLTFTIVRDMDLIATYEIPSEAFDNSITVTDGLNSKEVVFGMHEDATAGFDSGIDKELPPRPPEGAFYRRFNIPDYGLKADFRAVRGEKTIWELEVAPEGDRSISLEWDFSNTNHLGTLTLTDDLENPTTEIDMKSETSYEASESSDTRLYIISDNEK